MQLSEGQLKTEIQKSVAVNKSVLVVIQTYFVKLLTFIVQKL